MKKMLTKSQAEVIDFCKAFKAANDCWPTHRETRSHFGPSYCNVLAGMHKKGCINIIQRQHSNDKTVIIADRVSMRFCLSPLEQRIINFLQTSGKRYSTIKENISSASGRVIREMLDAGLIYSPDRGLYRLTDEGREYVK
jgi:hypothetical protein